MNAITAIIDEQSSPGRARIERHMSRGKTFEEAYGIAMRALCRKEGAKARKPNHSPPGRPPRQAVNDLDQAILKFLAERPDVALRTLANELSAKPERVRGRLDALKRLGLVHAVKYRLTVRWHPGAAQ